MKATVLVKPNFKIIFLKHKNEPLIFVFSLRYNFFYNLCEV